MLRGCSCLCISDFIQKDFWTGQCRGKLVFSDLGRRTATAEGNEEQGKSNSACEV